ncbi:MAG: 5'-methylthioadenosine phosphorylase [Myxococcota bacterium]
MSTVAVILGSAFERVSSKWQAEYIKTPWGEQTFYRVPRPQGTAYAILRHGSPHHFLPHQIPYRSMIWALGHLKCKALMSTSSVGVLDAALPLGQPMLLGDMLMLDNRLPDGHACTMFAQPTAEQGHLSCAQGLFSKALGQQIKQLAAQVQSTLVEDIVFGYACGPRTKTPAENRMWSTFGAHVNSMSLGPEIVLANELEIPCAGLVIGHKYSLPTKTASGSSATDSLSIAESLQHSRKGFMNLVEMFLQHATAVPFENEIFRFNA